MVATAKFPVTLEERLELGSGQVRFPASFDEFWELLETCEYPIEFHQNEIIAMSYEPDRHSQIAVNLGSLFNFLFVQNNDLITFNSNRPVYIESTGAVYNPDATVVGEPRRKFVYRPGMDAEMTAVVIVEVLSKNTRDHDLDEKLPAYKTIPTIEHIIYAESQRPYVTVHSRNPDTGKWTNIVYDEMDDTFLVRGQAIGLRQVYGKVKFVPVGGGA